MDLEALTPATFERYRGSTFRVAGEDDPLDLRLTGIDQLPTEPQGPRPEPFSLVFTGPFQRPLDQRSYRLEHTDLGELEIFLVPIGYDTDGERLYEAVFN